MTTIGLTNAAKAQLEQVLVTVLIDGGPPEPWPLINTPNEPVPLKLWADPERRQVTLALEPKDVVLFFQVWETLDTLNTTLLRPWTLDRQGDDTNIAILIRPNEEAMCESSL